MSLLQKYFSRKFFWRIVTTNTLLVVLFLLVFCSIIYVYSRNTTLELQQDANRKVLNQVNYNIDNLNDMVKSLAVSSFYDRDLISLMYTEEPEIFQYYNKLNKLDQIVNTNLFVSAVEIYNANNKCTYSNSIVAVSCSQQEKSKLQNYLIQQQNVPKLTLLPYTMKVGGIDRNVFAYFMYNSVGSYTNNESVLMVAVKPEWLFDNIRTLNELAAGALGNVFLVDNNGQVIDRNEQSEAVNARREEIIAKLKLETKPSGYFIVNNQEGKQIVSYMSSQLNQWKVISIQPYNQLFGRINQIGTFALFALIAFVALSFIASVLFSVRLYKPVGGLVNQLQLMPNRGLELNGSDKDEMTFLTNAYKNMQNNINQMQETGVANRQTLYEYFVREWISDSSGITAEQVRQYADGQIWLADQPFMLILLKIDDYAAYCHDRNELEKRLCRFATCNIAGEIVGEHYANQTIDMMGDHLVLLIQLPTPGGDSEFEAYAFITEQMHRIQDTLHNYYKLSLTAVLSEPIADYRAITTHYQLTQTHALYRMIAGKQTVITPQLYNSQQKRADEQVPAEQYRKLAESIKSNQQEQMNQRLDEVFRTIATFHCEEVDEAIMQLLMIINQTVREMKSPKAHSMAVVLQRYRRQVLEQETLPAMRQLIGHMLEELTIERKAGKFDKPEFLIGAVKEMITQNFTDPNLSLQSIADALKMSPGYLGRYFRGKESMSIADYINENRLTQSLHLLEQTDDSIVDIIKKIGFNNESNYFKLFKKRYGITPKEYRLTRNP